MSKFLGMRKSMLKSLRTPLLSIVGGIVVGAIILVVAGFDPVEGYLALVEGAFGGRNYANLVSTMVHATPIIGLSVACSVAFKAGLFNIGVEGQMVLGAVTSAIVAIYSPFPLIVTGLLAVLAAVLVSGAYALVAAWMDIQFEIPIFISTLLLNYPATYFATYLANHPFRDVASGVVQTFKVPEGLRIPVIIPRSQFHAGILLIPVLVALAVFVFRYTKAGYNIRISGFNMSFLKYGGGKTKRLEYRLMFISGAIAGVIGVLEVFGIRHRYIPGMLTAPLYAWTAVTTAILAQSNPLGVFFAGFLMAAIQNGGSGMERASSVPREITRVIQAVIILIVSAVYVSRSVDSNYSEGE